MTTTSGLVKTVNPKLSQKISSNKNNEISVKPSRNGATSTYLKAKTFYEKSDLDNDYWFRRQYRELTKDIKPLDIQVGGGHYKKYKIQPAEYSMQNGLNHCQANVIKYVTRYKDKGGKEDLLKAKHYIDLLIEFEGY